MICKAHTIMSSKYWLWHTFSWWCHLLIIPGLKITLDDSPGIGSLQCARFDCQDLTEGNMIPCSRSIWKMGRLTDPLDSLLEWDYLPTHQLRIYHFWQAIWLIGHVFFVGLADVQPGSRSLPQDLIVGVIHASYGGFHKWGYPKMYGLEWKILLKWMILRYPHFKKPPYVQPYQAAICVAWMWRNQVLERFSNHVWSLDPIVGRISQFPHVPLWNPEMSWLKHV